MRNDYETFRKNIINSYYTHTSVLNFVNITTVSETDGNFIQIGLRDRIPTSHFKDPHRYLILEPLGQIVATAEKRFLINKILATKGIERIKITRNNSYEKIIEALDKLSLSPMQNIAILMPPTIKYEYLINHNIYYDYNISKFALDFAGETIPVYSLPEKILKNNIIILEKDFGIWKIKQFDSQNIDVQIRDLIKGEKTEILSRVLIKFDILQKDLMKIIEISD